MAFYYDSSVILAAILGEPGSLDPAQTWDSVPVRVSSNLLKIECIVGLRKAGLAQRLPMNGEWVALRIDVLEPYFGGMYFKIMDQAIEEVIRGNADLALCRSLDAVHLATALYLRPQVDEELIICSLDGRLREVSTRFDFPLYPA